MRFTAVLSRLFANIYEKLGMAVKYVDASNSENVFDAVNYKTKLIWIETPSGPTLKVADIKALSEISKTYKSLLCVDNTMASPVFQQPLSLGADIVIHSSAKYLGGHSDLLTGIAITKNKEPGERLCFIQHAPGPFRMPSKVGSLFVDWKRLI